MFGIFLALAALGAVIIFQLKQIHTANNKRSETLDGLKANAVQSISCTKYWSTVQLLFMVICIVIGVYIWLNPASVNNEYVWAYEGLLLIFCVSVVINLIFNKKEQCLFYTKDSFYNDGKMIRFKAIQNISLPSGLGQAKVTLFTNHEEIKLTKEKAQALMRVKNESKS